ncbi:F-box domain containing protein [Tanacetum coccineum]
MVELPQDILYNIFSRLPIESLAHFQYVCKQWRKFITNPYLNKIHVEEEPIPIMFEQFEIVHPIYLCQLSFLPIIKGITSTTLEAEKDPIFEFWRQDLSPEFIGSLVVGFCNRLVLFYYSLSLHDGIRYIMINPLNKQCHELPPIKVPPGVQVLINSRESGGIGYDDSNT